MLHIETAKNQEIHLGIRKKNHLFSKSFAYALAIALGLHLAAALIFHIHSFFINDQVFAPVSVSADINSKLFEGDDAAIANLDEKEKDRFRIKPNFTFPQIPELTSKPVRLSKESSKHNDSLISFTEYEDDWHSLFLEKEKIRDLQEIKICISGNLGGVALVENGLNSLQNEVWKTLLTIPPYQTSFEVRVDGKTGRIFWQMVKGQIENLLVQQASEEILENMQFQTNGLPFVTSGEIEIVFAAGSKI